MTLEAEQKMYASFCPVRGLGYLMTFSEMLETMHENNLFDMFSEFSYLVHIPAVIPATSPSAQRSFIALRRFKTYFRSTYGATTCRYHRNYWKGICHLCCQHWHRSYQWDLPPSKWIQLFLLTCFMSPYERLFFSNVRISSLHTKAYVSASYDPRFFSALS